MRPGSEYIHCAEALLYTPPDRVHPTESIFCVIDRSISSFRPRWHNVVHASIGDPLPHVLVGVNNDPEVHAIHSGVFLSAVVGQTIGVGRLPNGLKNKQTTKRRLV